MRSTSRRYATCGVALLGAAVLATVPVAGQSTEALYVTPSGASLVPAMLDAPAVTGAVLPVRFGTFSTPSAGLSSDAPYGIASNSSWARPARGRVAEMPLQSQESGGFPYTQVGIGLGVAALMITAVLTANSGDPAELPRSGVVIVVPGS